jgi:hypothetical protein
MQTWHIEKAAQANARLSGRLFAALRHGNSTLKPATTVAPGSSTVSDPPTYVIATSIRHSFA